MNSTDNTAQTWRDLTDQLTTEQIVMFSEAEHRPPEDLLDAARHYAAQNVLQAVMAQVAAPAGTVDTSQWCDGLDDDETPSRTLYGERWCVGNVTAILIGEQRGDGSATWQIEFHEVDGTNGEVNAEQARELARVILDAADKLDQLDGTSPPFM